MFRISFRFSVKGMEGAVNLGSMISDHDDPFKALGDAQEHRIGVCQALRATMPMCRKMKPEDIEISVAIYDPQLLLFELPAKKRTEVMPDKKAYELYLNDSSPTLSRP